MEKKIRAFFWPWQLEEREQFFDRQSEQGWQLRTLGRISCRFARDEAARYRHRMTILPPDADAALRAFGCQKWEVCGTQGVWTCLRKPYDAHLAESGYTLPDPSAEDRIESRFRRWMRVLVWIVAICCVIAAGFAVWGYLKKFHLWQVAFPFAAVVIACAFPYIKLEGWLEAHGRLKPEPEKPQKKKKR